MLRDLNEMVIPAETVLISQFHLSTRCKGKAWSFVPRFRRRSHRLAHNCNHEEHRAQTRFSLSITRNFKTHFVSDTLPPANPPLALPNFFDGHQLLSESFLLNDLREMNVQDEQTTLLLILTPLRIKLQPTSIAFAYAGGIDARN